MVLWVSLMLVNPLLFVWLIFGARRFQTDVELHLYLFLIKVVLLVCLSPKPLTGHTSRQPCETATSPDLPSFLLKGSAVRSCVRSSMLCGLI